MFTPSIFTIVDSVLASSGATMIESCQHKVLLIFVSTPKDETNTPEMYHEHK